jgi:metal-responsive CopG/Arc/MetJ family transcriptional regulator
MAERQTTNDRRTTVTVSLPVQLIAIIEDRAQAEYRKVSQMVEVLIRKGLEFEKLASTGN